jgi:hypothetical protein
VRGRIPWSGGLQAARADVERVALDVDGLAREAKSVAFDT